MATKAGMARYQTELPESELPMRATSTPAKTHANNQASLLTWLGGVTRDGPGTCMVFSRALQRLKSPAQRGFIAQRPVD